MTFAQVVADANALLSLEFPWRKLQFLPFVELFSTLYKVSKGDDGDFATFQLYFREKVSFHKTLFGLFRKDSEQSTKVVPRRVDSTQEGVIVLQLSPRGFLLFAEIEVWQHPRQGVSFACEPKLRWGAYRL